MQYRSTFAKIASYVDFKIPKRLKKQDKAKITRYANRIGKALTKGYIPIKCKNDGRIATAHKAQGIRGLPSLKVAFIRRAGKGFKISINKDGTIRHWNSKSGVMRVTILAQFFDAEHVQIGEPEEEAARLVALARTALTHKPTRCAVAYWGGENSWATIEFLPELLVIKFSQYANSRGLPADSVNFYWVKQSKKVLAIQQRLRDDRAIAVAKKAKERRKSDV